MAVTPLPTRCPHCDRYCGGECGLARTAAGLREVGADARRLHLQALSDAAWLELLSARQRMERLGELDVDRRFLERRVWLYGELLAELALQLGEVAA